MKKKSRLSNKAPVKMFQNEDKPFLSSMTEAERRSSGRRKV